MKNFLRFRTPALLAALIFSLAVSAFSQGPHSINLSGYEFRLGTPCTINDQAGKCGVKFGGWTGGGGDTTNGWTPFPGNKRGLWSADVNYIGSADFGATVYLQSGSLDLLFRHQNNIFGTVTGGTVTWPSSASVDTGCGPGVAQVSVLLTINGSSGAFDGCLHDLPAGTVLPPTIWGTLHY